VENILNCQNFYGSGVSDTSVTLGVAQPNTIVPPELLAVKASGNFTVYLPPINTILPSPPATTQVITGVDGCFEMVISNVGGANITITPYGNDVTIPSTLSVSASVGSFIRIRTNPADSTWYQVGG